MGQSFEVFGVFNFKIDDFIDVLAWLDGPVLGLRLFGQLSL